MLLISAAQKEAREGSQVLLNTDEAQAVRASMERPPLLASSVGTRPLFPAVLWVGGHLRPAWQSHPGPDWNLPNLGCLVSCLAPTVLFPHLTVYSAASDLLSMEPLGKVTRLL